MEPVRSYREVHVGTGIGHRYDVLIGGKVDALIWESFVKPYLHELLESARQQGMTSYLDFACGTGRILAEGARHFDDATGLDLSDDMLWVARQRVPAARIVCADITREPEALTRTFDCVTMFRFLLNAEPPLRRDVLGWLRAHTHPGSLLIGNLHMYTLSFGGLLTVAARAAGNRSLNHDSRRNIGRLLDEAGFTVRSWRGYRFLPTYRGNAPLGDRVQLAGERACNAIGLSRCGSEQVFVAERR